MSVICPTVTPNTPRLEAYNAQLEEIRPFARRVQIDIMDGDFAPNKNTPPDMVWWPETMTADIHVMYRHPDEVLVTLADLKPQLIIFHVEADGDHLQDIEFLHRRGIKAGLAILKETEVAPYRKLIAAADHVLLFSGHLGFFGGQADLGVLSKVADVRAIKEDIEIGWDGGAKYENVQELARGGIDVINVGGGIHHADNPAQMYEKLCAAVEGIKP